MFDKVLVPLDGSAIAEAALGYAARVAELGASREIALLHLIGSAGSADDSGSHLAEVYLRYCVNGLEKVLAGSSTRPPEISYHAVQRHGGVLPGRANSESTAREILRFAGEDRADLIVMSTHGRSGFHLWFMGSVAEQILQKAPIPVLLVRPAAGSREPPAQLRQVLVPLDGSHPASAVLPYLEGLATNGTLKVTLLLVGPGSEDQAGANASRAAITDQPVSPRLQLETKVGVGTPEQQILQEAGSSPVDLIVLGSPQMGDLVSKQFSGMIYHVLHSAPVPVLLAPLEAGVTPPAPVPASLVYRCHQCGKEFQQEDPAPADRCARCHIHLRACGNCLHFDGIGCLGLLPYASETYPGNHCPRFRARRR